jgi:hypothetical protein
LTPYMANKDLQAHLQALSSAYTGNGSR